MPRKKKHRKRGKTKHKQRQLNNKRKQNKESLITNQSQDCTMSTTLLSSNAASYSTPVCTTKSKNDSFQMETPVRRIPLMNLGNPRRKSRCQDYLDEDIPVKTTPVNKRRSLNRQNETKLNNSWNVTNLNALFDSDIFAQNGDDSMDLDSNENRRRSRSSIPKLHSPFLEKESNMIIQNNLEHDEQDVITETPRVTQKILADIDMSKIQVPSQLNNTENRQNQGTNFIKSKEININPYLKEKQILSISQRAKWQKGDSMEELAFFSPQLFDAKSSSTPIQGLLNDLKEDVIKENLDMISNSKLGFISKIEKTPLRDVIIKTPRSKILDEQILNNSVDLAVVDSVVGRQENVNVNTPPLNDKILDKDKSNSIKLLGSNKRRSGISRIQNRTSPKISRLVSHSPMFSKNASHSRVSMNRRVSFDYHSCEPRTPIVQMGMCERIIHKIKRYSKESAKWSSKMMEACSHLGIQIKNSLASFCNVYERSRLDCSQKSCNCATYKAEISSLNVKIECLTGELHHLRQKVEEYSCGQKNSEKSIDKLREELVKQLSINFTDIRSELTCLKNQLQCFKSSAMPQPVATAPPPPPPVPPPPPPPPMPSIQVVPPKLLLGKKSKSAFGLGSETSDKGDARPVISLDEILKVKLKKTSTCILLETVCLECLAECVRKLDEKQEKQLRTWYEEVESEDEFSVSNAKGSHVPYGTDDSRDDPEYTQSNSSYSSGDFSEPSRSRQKRKKKRTQNAVALPKLKQTLSESSVDSDGSIDQEENERRMTTLAGQSHLSSDSVVNDNFNQIKLRRTRGGSATPNMTSLSTPGGASTISSELSTSPASSLNRLLDTGSVWRVKRLRKVGGYNSDYLHRRSPARSSYVAKGRRGTTDS